MSDQLWEQAETLAVQNYDVRISQGELTDGSTVYVAENPELEGCRSQGKTIEEAIANLHDARIDYIHSFLEDSLPVPAPKAARATIGTTSGTQIVVTQTYSPNRVVSTDDKDRSQPEEREAVYKLSLYL